jgi:hypothetical protein
MFCIFENLYDFSDSLDKISGVGHPSKKNYYLINLHNLILLLITER